MTFANKITNYSCDFKSKSSSIAESTIGCRKKSSRLPPVPLFFFLRKSLKSTIGRWRTTVYLRPSYKCVSVWPLSRALPVAPRDTTQASRPAGAWRLRGAGTRAAHSLRWAGGSENWTSSWEGLKQFYTVKMSGLACCLFFESLDWLFHFSILMCVNSHSKTKYLYVFLQDSLFKAKAKLDWGIRHYKEPERIKQYI